MIEKKNYITASFVDDARKNIEILLKGEGDEVISHTIELDNNHPDYKALLKIVDLETIHQNTRDKIKASQKIYKKELRALAKEEGLIFDIKDLKRKKVQRGFQKAFNKKDKTFYVILFKFFVDYIFSDSYDSEKDKDFLFTLKLESFELDIAKNCSDRNLQMQLRKAQHPVEVIEVLLKMRDYAKQQNKP